MKPTDEQRAALDMFGTGASMVIEAGAGTGKTSTLELLARSTDRRGQYIAFNKSIVVEAGKRMPATVSSSTAHSLAFRAIGKKYQHRLRTPRMCSDEIADRLALHPIVVDMGDGSKELAAGFLAGLVMRTVSAFCQSADPEPTKFHVPSVPGIDVVGTDGKRRWDNNDYLRGQILPAVRRAWADLVNPQGALPFRHDHYLKAWALTTPRIAADYILLDEAQDTNPVLAAVIDAQFHAQRVMVGDTAQQIYEWRGAVNALANMTADRRVFLTQSFRFGDAIAQLANRFLDMLDMPLRLRGTPSIASRLDVLLAPAAVLCRTNAVSVATVLEHKRAGRRVHLVGGGEEVVAFAKAALQLQEGGRTFHPELACFASWSQVQQYVADDPQGSELRLMVSLVDEYGVPTIMDALEHMTPEDHAQVVVSTAHKAKGREWRTVRIGSDFKLDRADDGELRLAYVAVTRARDVLDAEVLLKALAELDHQPQLPDAGDVTCFRCVAEGRPQGTCSRCAPVPVP